ncbi:MAG: alanine racemase [Gammaproteobacteria bacterium]|nr:alanine racemase [Gammaproteobacteria bacterium]
MRAEASWAEIDTAALRHNLEKVSQLVPQQPVMAVVKANAYGHELGLVIGALDEVDALAVARVEEGAAARAHGFGGAITVLEGALGHVDLELARQYRLRLVAHNEQQVDQLCDMTAGRLDVWLKIDSGMHRLGVDPGHSKELYQRLSQSQAVRQPPGLMTHFACADEPNNPLTRSQFNLFTEFTGGLAGERSIGNSAAIMAWPQFCQGWLRPGIMLYGISPFADSTGPAHGLQPAMTFRSRLIAVRTVRAGEAVGYASTWSATRDTRIGTAAVGYGDGYPGNLPAMTPVLVGDQPASLAGRVSMDMITIDLGPDSEAGIGDEVTLWGRGLPVETIARACGRIPYELVCGVSQRVPRIAVSS